MEYFRARSEVKGMFSLHVKVIRFFLKGKKDVSAYYYGQVSRRHRKFSAALWLRLKEARLPRLLSNLVEMMRKSQQQQVMNCQIHQPSPSAIWFPCTSHHSLITCQRAHNRRFGQRDHLREISRIQIHGWLPQETFPGHSRLST